MVAKVRALNLDQQKAHPGKGEFSPVELLQHMALAEQFDVELMKKRGPKELKGKSPKTNFMYRHAIKKMEAAQRLPTMGPMVPKSAQTVDEADRHWREVRAAIKGFLDQAEGPASPVMKSILGTLSAADLLRLFEVHMHYHETRFPS